VLQGNWNWRWGVKSSILTVNRDRTSADSIAQVTVYPFVWSLFRRSLRMFPVRGYDTKTIYMNRALGLGGLCQHNFEHNDRQIDVNVIEHINGSVWEHNGSETPMYSDINLR